MNYGVPYKGSKNIIAKDIIEQMPAAENFYDVFAGGCAITHAALLSGKYKNVYCNDLDWRGPELFRRAINGEYDEEKRWISREDFFRLKDTDPYVAFCWSFGAAGEGYAYAEELEPLKMRLHYLFYAENPHDARLRWKEFLREFDRIHEEIERLTVKVEELCKECGVEFRRNKDGTADAAGMKKDILKVLSADIRGYLRKALKSSGHTAADVDRLLGTSGMAGHYFGASQWALPTAEAYEKMKTIMPGLTVPWSDLKEGLERLERLERLESLERLKSLESLESLKRLQNLKGLPLPEFSRSDYRAVKIKPNSVVYCDIPYKGTDGYAAGDFDHAAFYEWAREQREPIFISEYEMPDDFKEVWRKRRAGHLSATNNAHYVMEKLFTLDAGRLS